MPLHGDRGRQLGQAPEQREQHVADGLHVDVGPQVAAPLRPVHHAAHRVEGVVVERPELRLPGSLDAWNAVR